MEPSPETDDPRRLKVPRDSPEPAAAARKQATFELPRVAPVPPAIPGCFPGPYEKKPRRPPRGRRGFVMAGAGTT